MLLCVTVLFSRRVCHHRKRCTLMFVFNILIVLFAYNIWSIMLCQMLTLAMLNTLLLCIAFWDSMSQQYSATHGVRRIHTNYRITLKKGYV